MLSPNSSCPPYHFRLLLEGQPQHTKVVRFEKSTPTWLIDSSNFPSIAAQPRFMQGYRCCNKQRLNKAIEKWSSLQFCRKGITCTPSSSFSAVERIKMSSEQHTLAILDDYAGLALPYFESIPDLKIDSYPETILPRDEKSIQAQVARLKPYSIICIMRERSPFPKEILSQLPNLKLLVTPGLRNLSIDLAAAREHGIIVAGTGSKRDLSHPKLNGLVMPAPNFDATTQQCFSLLLSLTSRIPIDNSVLRAGGRYQTGIGMTLSNKIYGCVGLGRLGTTAARTAILGFGMKVIAWSSSLTQEKADEAAERIGLPKGAITAVSKDELFKTSDVVSVHYVLSDRSRGMLGPEELGMMKKTALLLNTSRGPIIQEQALFDVLDKGKIRGAGLDVFWTEPLPVDSVWRSTKWGEDGRSDVVLSPHMGYVVEETMNKWYAEQADSVQKFLKGEEIPDILT